MILAIDVDYRPDGAAITAGVAFADWRSDRVEATVLRRIDKVASYRPGYFYERELPCIMSLLSELPFEPQTIVIDGYVWLGAARQAGLGAHLHAALNKAIPVVGVAKTRFRDTPPETEVLRGHSARPLYVTAVGMDEVLAKMAVRSMAATDRMPTMLSAVDRACRTAFREQLHTP